MSSAGLGGAADGERAISRAAAKNARSTTRRGGATKKTCGHKNLKEFDIRAGIGVGQLKRGWLRGKIWRC